MIDINLIFYFVFRKLNNLFFKSIGYIFNIYINEMYNIMNYLLVLVKLYNLVILIMCLERSEIKRNEKIIRFINMVFILIFEKVEL